jgi:hypothetical protein
LARFFADVAVTDVYVLLIVQRYGYRSPENNPQQPSIIQLEYREASRHGSIAMQTPKFRKPSAPMMWKTMALIEGQQARLSEASLGLLSVQARQVHVALDIYLTLPAAAALPSTAGCWQESPAIECSCWG